MRYVNDHFRDVDVIGQTGSATLPLGRELPAPFSWAECRMSIAAKGLMLTLNLTQLHGGMKMESGML